VAIGVLMATIDSSIVNVALPVIARHFGAPMSGLTEWVIIGYLVVLAALLLTAGRLSDSFGRRGTWAAGLALFTTASAFCGAAPSLGALIGFRAVQGIGSALVMAVSPAMLVTAFPADQRGRALGLNAFVVGVGISLGPTLGGAITQHLGWRWIFYVNIPLGAVGVGASMLRLRPDRAETPGRVDWLGAGLLALGLGGMTGVLSFGHDVGWRSAPLLGAASFVLIALSGFGVHLARASDPLLDPRLFDNRVFSSATAALFLSFVSTFAVAFLVAFYLEQLRGWPAERAGVLLTPLPVTSALVSPMAGALADRFGTRGLAAGGMLIAAAGLALLARIDERTPVADLVIALVVIGAGQAVFRPPNNSALMGSAPRSRQGVAAGVMATARVVGQSMSIAFAGALFAGCGGAEAARAARRAATAGYPPALAQSFLRGMHAALVGCAVVAVASSAAAFVRGREGR
jgi:EmrB/QacA subfamily drug resistance transporter